MSTPVRFLTSLGQVLATMGLYNEGHPACQRALDDSFQELGDLLAGTSVLKLSFIAGDVVYERRVLRELKEWDWAERLAGLGIERLEIDAGVTREDYEQFLRDTFQRSRGEAMDTAEVRHLRATEHSLRDPGARYRGTGRGPRGRAGHRRHRLLAARRRRGDPVDAQPCADHR